MRLDGKVAIVTGGSRGLGRAVALRLAEERAVVAIVYASDRASADETRREIEARGGKAQAYRCDVANPDETARVVKAVYAELSLVVDLVYIAGINRDS